jgi:hypothetical protein
MMSSNPDPDPHTPEKSHTLCNSAITDGLLPMTPGSASLTSTNPQDLPSPTTFILPADRPSFLQTVKPKSPSYRKRSQSKKDLNDVIEVNPARYPVLRFSEDDLPELKKALQAEIGADLLGVRDVDFDTAQKVVKETICDYIQCWNDPTECDKLHVHNGLTFFFAYLNGLFKNNLDDIIVVDDDSYQVWKYTCTISGELLVLKSLMKEKQGTFANPANGYWKSNLDFEKAIMDHQSKYGLILSADVNAGYLARTSSTPNRLMN